jgi:hypothetical protein
MNAVIWAIWRSLLVFVLLHSSHTFSYSQETPKDHSHAIAAMHGGLVTMSKHYHFEVVFKQDGINIYLYDSLQMAQPTKGVGGQATLELESGDAFTVPFESISSYQMTSKQKERHRHKTMGQDYLKANVDLRDIEPGKMKAIISVKGLPNKDELETTFTAIFQGHVEKKESHPEQHGSHKH